MRSLLCLVALALIASDVSAGPRKRTRHVAIETPHFSFERTVTRGDAPATDALSEVNAARARRGKPPFIHDPGLTVAAERCAQIRAANGIKGHINDFAHLPPGVTASAAGCGALEPSWGWGTCCTYDNYRYAGAAVVVDGHGRRFMHLFVR
jgi:hypothetical protein